MKFKVGDKIKVVKPWYHSGKFANQLNKEYTIILIKDKRSGPQYYVGDIWFDEHEIELLKRDIISHLPEYL